MEGFRAFAIWLVFFGTVGTLCQPRNPVITKNPDQSRGISNEVLVEGNKNVHQVDQQEAAKETSKKRVVRWTAEPDPPYHPTPEQLQRANDRRLRQNAEATRTATAQREASRILRTEEERRRAGDLEMAERIRNIERRRQNFSH